MADSSAAHWYPTAAYLYTLHLDAPALAWEYLRRNPDYRRDWLRRRRRAKLRARPFPPAWLEILAELPLYRRLSAADKRFGAMR